MSHIAAVVSNGCSPDPRVLREARWLVEAGHKVTIHAFDRLEDLPLSEESEGIQIIRHRVGKTPYGGAFSTLFGLRRFRKSVSKSLGEIDLLHCHDADTLPLANSTKAKVLFDMHDLHHTWARMPNPNSPLRNIIAKRMEQTMLRRAKKAHAVITSSEGFANWLSSKEISAKAIENRPLRQTKLPIPATQTIGYFGKIREKSSFELLIEAMRQIPTQSRPRLLIAGDGTHVNEITNLAASSTDLNIEIRGPFDHSEIPTMMSEISLMFAMYSPDRGNINEGALPAKMFEAAAFGRPTIVNQDTPMGELCELEELGVTVEWGDSVGLAAAIIALEGRLVSLDSDEIRERDRFLKVIEKLRI